MQTKKKTKGLFDTLECTARYQVKELGLNRDDAEDYISIFLLKCLQIGPEVSLTYLTRAGHNAAIDYLRLEFRRRKRECSSSRTDDVNLPTSSPPQLIPTEKPLSTRLLSKELKSIIVTAVLELNAEQQEIWRLLVIEGRSATEVAPSLGRSSHAVRQSLTSIRKHLRSVLVRHDFDFNTAQKYLYEIQKNMG